VSISRVLAIVTSQSVVALRCVEGKFFFYIVVVGLILVSISISIFEMSLTYIDPIYKWVCKGARRPKSCKNPSRFSPRIKPITRLHFTHVVKEVGTGALFCLREYRTSPLSVPKRQHWSKKDKALTSNSVTRPQIGENTLGQYVRVLPVGKQPCEPRPPALSNSGSVTNPIRLLYRETLSSQDYSITDQGISVVGSTAVMVNDQKTF
jgi:hypothetical protein